MPKTENPTIELVVRLEAIADDARNALAVLEDLTTDQFSRGEDRPARKALARILAVCGALDDETAREYGLPNKAATT